MRDFKFNAERCTACGLCAAHCTEDVIRSDGAGHPVLARAPDCLQCGHCEAVCPRGALRWSDGPAADPVIHGEIGGPAMERFLRGKRSCRHFRRRPVERSILEGLVRVASVAPSSKNCEERCFLVVTDPERLRRLRIDLVKHMRRVRFAFRWLTRRPLTWTMPDETVAALRRMRGSFEHMLARESRGEDAIFYNAPAVVFIGGIGKDPFGKDNALAAQHYLMAQAEAAGLGSCIMGYAQAAPKIVARHLDVPRFYRVYGVVALGHPAHRFHTAATRKAPTVSWV